MFTTFLSTHPIAIFAIASGIATFIGLSLRQLITHFNKPLAEKLLLILQVLGIIIFAGFGNAIASYLTGYLFLLLLKTLGIATSAYNLLEIGLLGYAFQLFATSLGISTPLSKTNELLSSDKLWKLKVS